MSATKKPLTYQAIKNAKSDPNKAYRLPDLGHSGLYVDVRPTGGKFFRWRYRFPKGGPEQTLTFGPFPEITLDEARSRWADGRKLLAHGTDPGEAKKAQEAAESGANSFEAVALEWLNVMAPPRTPGHMRTIESRLRLHLFPWIGKRQVDGVTPQELIDIARRLETKGHRESAHRVNGVAAQVFDYAIRTGRAQNNPARAITKALLPVQEKRLAAITDPAEIGPLLLACDRYPSRNPCILYALKLSPLVFLRPGELRRLEWMHMDFDAAEIRLPIEHMKRRLIEKEARQGEIVHTVPLSRQALNILAEVHKLTGPTPERPARRFVFTQHNHPDKCISGVAVLNALRRLGYTGEEMTAHGFRHMASTNLRAPCKIPFSLRGELFGQFFLSCPLCCCC